MLGKTILVLGGGIGGVAAALTLRRLLPAQHKIILVDRQLRTYLCGSLPSLIIGERKPLKISRSLGSLLQRGIIYIQGEVEGIEVTSRRVYTNAGNLEYDYLILSPGVEYDWDAVPGSSEVNAFYDLNNARRLRNALRHFRRGRVIVAISRLPYKCPPAPYEAAMLMDWFFSEKGVRKDIDIHLFTPEHSPLMIVGEAESKTLMRHLVKRGITVHTGENLVEVNPDIQRSIFLSGETISYDLMVTIPVHRSPSVVREAGLTDGSGWVPVSPNTLSTEQDGVFALGDVTFLPMSNGSPLPKAGVFASGAGELVARNLAAEINGGIQGKFTGYGGCFLDHGGGKAAMIRGSFLAQNAPDVHMESPSARLYRQKLRFEYKWRHWAT